MATLLVLRDLLRWGVGFYFIFCLVPVFVASESGVRTPESEIVRWSQITRQQTLRRSCSCLWQSDYSPTWPERSKEILWQGMARDGKEWDGKGKEWEGMARVPIQLNSTPYRQCFNKVLISAKLPLLQSRHASLISISQVWLSLLCFLVPDWISRDVRGLIQLDYILHQSHNDNNHQNQATLKILQ